MVEPPWVLLELALSVPATATCLAPDCGNACDWTSRRGPRRMYCSRTCAQRTRATREELENALALLQEELIPSVTGQPGEEARDLEARILWILRRYPAPGWEE